MVVSGQAATTYDPGTMDHGKIYFWQIVAWDDNGARTTGPIWSFSTEQLIPRPPNIPDTPHGTMLAWVHRTYEFDTETIDPGGDQVYYKWDWGDGTFSDWIGPFNSGMEATATHSWSKKDVFV